MEKTLVCPWWLGYAFLIPLRKLKQDPQIMLGPHIKPGMKIMDYGSAMGYFSIPLAQMTGSSGKVYCVDIQEKMLTQLNKRAIKYKVSDIIETRLIGKNYQILELINQLDFVLLFYVAHEVPDRESLFKDLFSMLKPGGKIFFVEPEGHVNPIDFEKSITLAKKAGFMIMDDKPVQKGLSAFLVK